MPLNACLMALLLGAAPPEVEPAQLHARPRLVCETESLAAGGVGTIGITFAIDPEWHLYWNGWNDSGGTIEFTLTLPPGFTADEAQWPAPKRLVLPGEVLDHVYENEVTLVIPVHVPVKTAGTSISISASLRWLACSNACIAEKADAFLSVPVAAVGTTPKPGPDAPLFEKARARLPKPLPAAPAARAVIDDSKALIEFAGAKSLVFFPGIDCRAPVDAVKGTRSEGPVLEMALKPSVGDTGHRFRGVLEVSRGAGTSAAYYQIDVSGLETDPARK